MEDAWKSQVEALGELIRSQRNLARLSLRDMAELTGVSNAYLSQIERGLHEPSVKVLTAVAKALNLSADALLAQAGLIGDDDDQGVRFTSGTEVAILADPRLTGSQKEALISVYRSYVAERP